MQLTRQSDYAIRLLMALARQPANRPLPARMAAEQLGVPEDFLHKTIQVLARAGLVATQKGPQGGVRLTGIPEEITLAQVITAVEGPLAINPCLRQSLYCPRQEGCAARKFLGRLQQLIQTELAAETIAGLVAEEDGIRRPEATRRENNVL